MTRIHRRLRLFAVQQGRARRFDPGQNYLQRAARGRVARKLRAALRRLDPVVLVTPRWSQAPRFLDDIASDLAVGEPPVVARPLSLVPLTGRSVEESWAWLAQAVVEFCGISLGGPIAQAVSRDGFRTVMGNLFRRTLDGPLRVLMVHGVEHLNVEARDDLLRAFEAHMREAGAERRLGLLLAGSVDGPNFEFEGSERVLLRDFSTEEAAEALAEYIGPVEPSRLAEIVSLVGGVPALLDRLGAEYERTGRLMIEREALWRALGPLAEELRGAVSLVNAVDGLAGRLEEVSDGGMVPTDDRWDRMLISAGLLAVDGRRKVSLRAPLLAELAGHG